MCPTPHTWATSLSIWALGNCMHGNALLQCWVAVAVFNFLLAGEGAQEPNHQCSAHCADILLACRTYGHPLLQEYGVRKRMEHAMKASVFGKAISVTDPHSYRVRFVQAMNSLFVCKN